MHSWCKGFVAFTFCVRCKNSLCHLVFSYLSVSVFWYQPSPAGGVGFWDSASNTCPVRVRAGQNAKESKQGTEGTLWVSSCNAALAESHGLPCLQQRSAGELWLKQQKPLLLTARMVLCLPTLFSLCRKLSHFVLVGMTSFARHRKVRAETTTLC